MNSDVYKTILSDSLQTDASKLIWRSVIMMTQNTANTRKGKVEGQEEAEGEKCRKKQKLKEAAVKVWNSISKEEGAA